MDADVKTGGCENASDAKRSYKVIHIHPTLRCNLFCRHCYSSSAPNIKHKLDLHLIKPFLEYAFDNGFNIISVSGGEPFLYDQLKELLMFAKQIGYATQVATNGMLLKAAKSRECLDLIDLIAISVDGKAEEHDKVRCLDGAFDKTVEGIKFLNRQKKDFGIIHTITNQSWQNLIALADFLFENGAKLFQLHPLEFYGRAKDEYKTDRLTQESLHKTYILSSYLQAKYFGKMHVQIDFLHRDYILKYPETVCFHGDNFKITTDNFSEFIKTIVIDENGSVFPVSYGFSKEYEICKLQWFRKGLHPFRIFTERKGEELYNLISQCFDEILLNKENDLVAWTEYIVARSFAKTSETRGNMYVDA